MSGPLVEISYFQPVCRKVLNPYLELFGFEPIMVGRNGVERLTIAGYSNGEIMIRFSYWPEDFPEYCVMIGLGFLHEHCSPSDSGVALSYAIPVDKQEVWRFRNEEELNKVLCHICEDVLPAYAEPLWKDPQLLQQLIKRFYSEQSAGTETERVDRERRQAESAFKAGNYSEAAKLYSLFSPVDLTPTDRKRWQIARKKLSELQ